MYAATNIEGYLPMINTHAIVKMLIEKGFSEVQSEAITEAVTSGQYNNLEKFASKEQLSHIEKELAEIKELQKACATKAEVAEIKAQMVTRVEFEARMDGVQRQISDMKQFLIPFVIGNTALILATLGLVVSLFLK